MAPRVPVAIVALLAMVGLAMLIVGGSGYIRPLTIIGSLVSALALGALLYWRAALISYWQMAAVESGDSPRLAASSPLARTPPMPAARRRG